MDHRCTLEKGSDHLFWAIKKTKNRVCGDRTPPPQKRQSSGLVLARFCTGFSFFSVL